MFLLATPNSTNQHLNNKACHIRLGRVRKLVLGTPRTYMHNCQCCLARSNESCISMDLYVLACEADALSRLSRSRQRSTWPDNATGRRRRAHPGRLRKQSSRESEEAAVHVRVCRLQVLRKRREGSTWVKTRPRCTEVAEQVIKDTAGRRQGRTRWTPQADPPIDVRMGARSGHKERDRRL